jgi:hypothetical protein
VKTVTRVVVQVNTKAVPLPFIVQVVQVVVRVIAKVVQEAAVGAQEVVPLVTGVAKVVQEAAVGTQEVVPLVTRVDLPKGIKLSTILYLIYYYS